LRKLDEPGWSQRIHHQLQRQITDRIPTYGPCLLDRSDRWPGLCVGWRPAKTAGVDHGGSSLTTHAQLSQVGQGAAAIVRSWLPEPPNSPTVVDLPAPTGPARGRQRATFARTNSRSFGRPASGTRPCTRSTYTISSTVFRTSYPLTKSDFILKQALCPDPNPARALRDCHQPKQFQRTGCPGIGNLELISFIPSILETPAKSPNGSVSFQVCGQSVCRV
jgi:hypothetical protein